MGWEEWQTPAWQTPVDRADRVELLSLPERTIVPWEGWPDAFFRHVDRRVLLTGPEAQRIIQQFRDLEPGESARCHMPPWGLALYAGDTLLLTVTLCYACDSAHVYADSGQDLRAFDTQGQSAVALRRALEHHLPLSRDDHDLQQVPDHNRLALFVDAELLDAGQLPQLRHLEGEHGEEGVTRGEPVVVGAFRSSALALATAASTISRSVGPPRRRRAPASPWRGS